MVGGVEARGGQAAQPGSVELNIAADECRGGVHPGFVLAGVCALDGYLDGLRRWCIHLRH